VAIDRLGAVAVIEGDRVAKTSAIGRAEEAIAEPVGAVLDPAIGGGDHGGVARYADVRAAVAAVGDAAAGVVGEVAVIDVVVDPR
jgi:hypothetical protein